MGGANPCRPEAESSSPLDTARLRERRWELIRAAEPFLDALSRAAGGHRHAVMLTDSRSMVLHVVGDEQSVHGPERVPGPGALLEERVCSSHGVGTALAEDSDVALVGPEHFIQDLHLFTCQGIPLRDGDGGVAGALSISVRRPEVGLRLREILVCSAHAIETELLSARLEETMGRVLSAQRPTSEDLGRLLRDVVQARTAARHRIEVAAEQLARSRLTNARALLQLADAVLERFRRQAALWRALALDEAAAPRPVALDVALRELVEMLEVEAAVSEVEVVLHAIDPVVVYADPHTLARTLFRTLLNAIHRAYGGALHVDLLQGLSGGELCLTPAPGPGLAHRDGQIPAPIRLVVPAVM